MKYMISMAADFGVELKGKLFADATAAIGIAQRSGLGGRTRHIQVQWLWVQQAVSEKELAVAKVTGTENMADILTKAAPAEVLNKHLSEMGFEFSSGTQAIIGA